MKNLLFSILLLSYSIQSPAQWFWQNPKPNGLLMDNLKFINNSTGYIWGGGGVILKTIDGGNNWIELDTQNEGYIHRVFFLNNSIGWYLSSPGCSLYKTTDGGINWTYVSDIALYSATDFYFLDELNGFASGFLDLCKTTNGGYTWSKVNSVILPSGFHFIDDSIGFVGGHSEYYKTTDGGTNWISRGLPTYDFSPAKIFAYDINNIFMVGTAYDPEGQSFPSFFHSQNGGVNWSIKTFGHHVSDVYFESPSNGWICAGEILRTTNGGISWDSTGFDARQFSFNDSKSWSIINNSLNHTDNGWLTATPQIKSVFEGFLYEGIAKDTNVIFACGSNRTIIGTEDGGLNWRIYYSSSVYSDLNGISINENEIWSVGDQGIIICSKDNGKNWTETYIGASWLGDITFTSNGIGFIVGRYQGEGAILTTLDAGLNWTLVESFPDLYSIEKIKFSNDELGWALGSSNKLLRSSTFGRTWEVVNDTIGAADNIAVYGDNVWVTSGNKILRSTNRGETWESYNIFSYTGIGTARCDVDFTSSTVGYITSNDGRVFKTTDGGVSWIVENSPKGRWHFACDFVNEEVGWVFGYPGIVLSRNPNLVSVEEITSQNIHAVIFYLSDNYPNPFNPSTTIKYEVSSRQFVVLKVYDLLGREVVTLIDEEKPAGEYEVEFNAGNLASGVYYYQLKAGDPSSSSGQSFIQTKKMILLK